MNASLTHQYVRNKLSPAATKDYELRMLESPELQDELEEALMLQQALGQDKAAVAGFKNTHWAASVKRPYQFQWALAASAALLFICTSLLTVNVYYNGQAENELLRNQIADLGKPRADVVFASVKIMRSAGNMVPDSIIQLPSQDTTIMLDIELGSRSRYAGELVFTLDSESHPVDLSWLGSPDADGFTTVAIDSEKIPAGLVWLQVSAKNGETLERRLLEFRASGQD